ncbi:unnamed protein product, partial [Prorocentrum cordatum]
GSRSTFRPQALWLSIGPLPFKKRASPKKGGDASDLESVRGQSVSEQSAGGMLRRSTVKFTELMGDPNATEISIFGAFIELLTFSVRRPHIRAFNRMKTSNPQLEERLLEEVTSDTSVVTYLQSDAYNLYFMTLLKKQPDGCRLPVSFPDFWKIDYFGGWPMKTFIIQMLSLCIVASGCEFTFQELSYLCWGTQLVGLSVSRLLGELFFRDVMHLECYYHQLLGTQSQNQRAYKWLDKDRRLALVRSIQIKTALATALFVTTYLVVVLSKDATSSLKGQVACHFVSIQGTISFAVLKAADAERRLGDEGSLYAGLGEYNMQVTFIARDKTATHEDHTCAGHVWHLMNEAHFWVVLLVLTRIPILHFITWGLVFGN